MLEEDLCATILRVKQRVEEFRIVIDVAKKTCAQARDLVRLSLADRIRADQETGQTTEPLR